MILFVDIMHGCIHGQGMSDPTSTSPGPFPPTLFSHPQFGEIRTIMVDDRPWFVATDVARALAYTNPQKAIRDHCKGVNDSFTMDKRTPFKIIPESDLYRLVLRSKLPSAEQFQDWVVEEVLPSIRKTGGYHVTSNLPDFSNPAEAARAWADMYEQRLAVETKAEAYRQKGLELTARVIEDQPKVELHDRLMATDQLLSVGEVARLLGTGQQRFFEWLRASRVLRADHCWNQPFQAHIDAGYIKIKETVVNVGGVEKSSVKSLFTAKGLAWIQKKYTTHAPK